MIPYASNTGTRRNLAALREAGRCLRLIAGQTPTKFGDRIIACGDSWRSNSASLRMGDGIPLSVARRHLRAYGNAVVPQVAEWIGRRIMQAFESKVQE